MLQLEGHVADPEVDLVTLLDLEPPLLDHFDRLPIGDDPVLRQQFEAPLGERHHLSLLHEEAMAPAPGIDLDEEAALPRAPDGTGGEPLCRPQVEPAHGRIPGVFTARTTGVPPLANSSTVTDAGATPIR